MTIEEFEQRVGFKLTEAQKAYVRAIDSGERIIVMRGRAVGWSAAQKAVVHCMREDRRM